MKYILVTLIIYSSAYAQNKTGVGGGGPSPTDDLPLDEILKTQAYYESAELILEKMKESGLRVEVNSLNIEMGRRIVSLGNKLKMADFSCSARVGMKPQLKSKNDLYSITEKLYSLQFEFTVSSPQSISPTRENCGCREEQFRKYNECIKENTELVNLAQETLHSNNLTQGYILLNLTSKKTAKKLNDEARFMQQVFLDQIGTSHEP